METLAANYQNGTETCTSWTDITSTSLDAESIVVLFVQTTQRSRRRNLLIEDDIQGTLNKVLSNVVQVVIDVLGVFTNIINIIVFSKIGFKDSVTVALFGLAISDLGYVFLSAASQAFDILDAGVGLRPFEPMKNVAYQVLWWNNMFYDVTTIITVFTAVQKCACVAIPLIFKRVFTSFRAMIIVSVIYAAVIIYYIPVFANPGKRIRFDPVVNWTRLWNYYQPDNELVYEIFHQFSRVTLPFVSQTTVIICVIVLIVKLRQALKKRHSMRIERGRSDRNDGESSKDRDKTNAKELRAIQTVILVSAIFVICNLPDVLITVTSALYEDFSESGKYESTYRLCGALQDVFAVTNSAITIVVYFNYNSKYRQKFQDLAGAVWRGRPGSCYSQS